MASIKIEANKQALAKLFPADSQINLQAEIRESFFFNNFGTKNYIFYDSIPIYKNNDPIIRGYYYLLKNKTPLIIDLSSRYKLKPNETMISNTYTSKCNQHVFSWSVTLVFIEKKSFSIGINDLKERNSTPFYYDYRISIVPDSFTPTVIKDFAGGYYKSQPTATTTEDIQIILEPQSLHSSNRAFFIVEMLILPNPGDHNFSDRFVGKYDFLNNYNCIDNVVNTHQGSEKETVQKAGIQEATNQAVPAESSSINLLPNVFPELEILFKESWFADVIIIVDGKEIMAHKCILAAHSTTFCEILDPNSTKIAKTVIEVKDFSYETMHEILRFIYTRQVHNYGEESIKELIKAAQKYNIQPLLLKCQEVLLTYLNDDNAIEFIKFADSVGAEELKLQAIEIVILNGEKLQKEQLMSLNSESLCAEILLKALKKQF